MTDFAPSPLPSSQAPENAANSAIAGATDSNINRTTTDSVAAGQPENNTITTPQKPQNTNYESSEKATAAEFQREAEGGQEKRRDDDVANERALDQLLGRLFDQIVGTKIGNLSGGYVSGGIGSKHSTNAATVNHNYYYGDKPGPTADPAKAGSTVSDKREPDGPWPSSAFAACSDNVDDIAFLISAAVLDGRTIGAVQLAAFDLARRLSHEIKLPVDTAPPLPHLRSIDRLFEKFHISVGRVPDESGNPSSSEERVRFVNPTDASDVLIHSWTRLSGFPNWSDHLTRWLRDLGSKDMQEVRVAAGASAGFLWASGLQQIETEIADFWFSHKSLWPLDALDGCYATAAGASRELHEKIRRKLWAWGNLTHGDDGVCALRHLSTRGYRRFDSAACFDGLEALLGQGNLPGLVHAQETYERLFVTAMDEPEYLSTIAESLLRVLDKAKSRKDGALRLRAMVVALTLFDVERRSKGQRFFVMDRVLSKAPDPTQLARLANAISAGSAMQALVIQKLRELFIRAGVNASTAGWTDNRVLRLFARMYEAGDADERQRLFYYLEDWSVAAADQSATAGLAAQALLDHMRRG